MKAIKNICCIGAGNVEGPTMRVIASQCPEKTVCASLKMIAEKYSSKFELAFANGGDQNNDTIPEKLLCNEIGLTLIDGLGYKIQSSSWLLKS